MGCCGETINLPDVENGDDGLTYYPHVAYADNVVSGSPDIVTNYSPVPLPTSYYWAVIFSLSPVHPGVASAFEDKWALIRGADGTGSSGIQVSLNGTVTVDPVTNLNFIPAGLTGVDVLDAGGGQADVTIVTAGLIKTYRADLVAAAGTYVPGAYYWIVDVGDGEVGDMPIGYYGLTGASFTSYDHKAGIILRAINDTTLDYNGIYIARVPDRTVITGLFKPYSFSGIPFLTNTFYENYNEVYECIVAGNHNDVPASDITNFTFITKDNSTYYTTEIHRCNYDYINNIIISRSDFRNNILKNVAYEIYNNDIIKKCFRWGYNGYFHNKITFSDTLTTRTPYTIRDPDFETSQIYIDFSNFDLLIKTNVDQNIGDDLLNFNFTQIYNNEFYDGYIISSSIDSCRIFNNKQTASLSNVKLTNTAIVNFNSPNSFNGNILNKCVIGDIYYGANSNDKLLDNIINITYPNVRNNLSAKNWTVVVGSPNGDINTSTPHMDCGAVPHYLNVGDIVAFTNISGSGSNYVAVVANRINAFQVDFTVAPSTDYLNTNFTFRAHIPSVPTSFNSINKNIMNDVIIRGVNKDDPGTTIFNRNNLDKVLIENYPQHPYNTILFPTYYDEPGLEIGASARGFSDNKIQNTIFINNKILSFYENNIEGAYYYYNTNNTGVSDGFLGNFYGNIIKGDYPLLTEYTAASTSTNTSVKFETCKFASGTSFGNNLFERNTGFRSVTLSTSSSVTNCQYKALHGFGYPLSGVFTYNIGWDNVIVEASTPVVGLTFEGRLAGFANMRIGRASSSDIIGPGAPVSLLGFNFRDLYITGTNGDNDSLNPLLFGANLNPIVAATAIEGVAAGTLLGAITYQTTTWTLTITTQMPHLVNTVGSTIRIGIDGFTLNMVRATTILADGQADGKYMIYSPGSSINFDGVVSAVTDEYTFEIDITTNTAGYYLLHSTNAVVDGDGTADPGPGITGAFDTTRRDAINFRHWYKKRKNALSAVNYGQFSHIFSTVSPEYTDITSRIALDVTVPPSTSARNIYTYYNYTLGTTLLYDSGTTELTLPKFIEQMGGTVILGSHTPGPFTIDKISNLPEGIPVKFVTVPGNSIVFSLTNVAAMVDNEIIDDGATSYTITCYVDGSDPSLVFYDEIIIMRDNGINKVLTSSIAV